MTANNRHSVSHHQSHSQAWIRQRVAELVPIWCVARHAGRVRAAEDLFFDDVRANPQAPVLLDKATLLREFDSLVSLMKRVGVKEYRRVIGATAVAPEPSLGSNADVKTLVQVALRVGNSPAATMPQVARMLDMSPRECEPYFFYVDTVRSRSQPLVEHRSLRRAVTQTQIMKEARDRGGLIKALAKVEIVLSWLAMKGSIRKTSEKHGVSAVTVRAYVLEIGKAAKFKTESFLGQTGRLALQLSPKDVARFRAFLQSAAQAARDALKK